MVEQDQAPTIMETKEMMLSGANHKWKMNTYGAVKAKMLFTVEYRFKILS